jgi:hypothetical protein
MITDPELLHAHTERARPQRHEREHRPCYYYYPRRDETRRDETTGQHSASGQPADGAGNREYLVTVAAVGWH